jgi:hypothetical protein
MADVCVKEIEMRATSIWEDLHRALVMTGVRPNTELSTELKRVFNEGGDGELIAAIKERRWRERRRLVPRERALCAIAEKLSATAPRVTVEDWDALRSLGFDEMGCLEVAHIVGIFNYLTKLADGFGLELHLALLQAARSGMPLRRAGG